MSSWRPQLNFPWSEPDLEAVFSDALRVLAEVGVECRHTTVAQRLIDWGGQRNGDRVCFPADRVRGFVDARRSGQDPEAPDREPDRLQMGGCWACLFYCDPETLEIRKATGQEVAQMCRLWDARGLRGVVPVVPGDVPPELETVAAEHIALTNSRFLGGSLTATDPEVIRHLIDMNLAAGRKYTFMDQVSISPLRFNTEGLDLALQFIGKPDVRLHLAGFIPMAGASCPLDPRSAAVQASAESISFALLCDVLGAEGGIGVRIEPMDFQYSVIVFGSPEWCLYRALANQMTAYLNGRPFLGGQFRSTAKRPGAHSCTERTAVVLWQALMGARVFGAVGQLSVDEVFSPQQAVLDGEILRYAERVIRGLDFDKGPEDALALIQEGVELGGFMNVMDTARRYREFYCFPEIFRHWNVGRWREEGSPSVLGEAWDRAQHEIASSTFELPDDQRAEVDRIYQRVGAYLGG